MLNGETTEAASLKTVQVQGALDGHSHSNSDWWSYTNAIKTRPQNEATYLCGRWGGRLDKMGEGEWDVQVSSDGNEKPLKLARKYTECVITRQYTKKWIAYLYTRNN